MDDELETNAIDDRIRRAVRADAATARRTAAAALTAGTPRLPVRARRRPIVIATVAAAVVAAAVAGWRGRSVPRPPASAGSLSIRGSGATLVVDDADGRRWIVRRGDQERPNGGYVIVFPR